MKPEPLKILVAEDDIDDRMFFEEGLAHVNLPHQLFWAQNHTEIFDVLAKEPKIDLVILDINLPGLDGKECLKQIKKHEKYNLLPVVMMTSSKSEKDINEVYAIGAHYYVVKPYSQINQIETLRRLFNLNWKRGEPIPPRGQFVINLAFT